MTHEDDKFDLDLHRVIDNSIIGVMRQFGLAREEVLSRFEAFIELDREEERELAQLRRAIESEVQRQAERA